MDLEKLVNLAISGIELYFEANSIECNKENIADHFDLDDAEIIYLEYSGLYIEQ